MKKTGIKIFDLDDEAENEIYLLIDKHIRSLPKKEDGTINKEAEGFQHNDVDALRHAYVSGVYTMEYGETVAWILGWANELSTSLSGGNLRSRSNVKNMDYWNNQVGRKYGKKSKSRKELFQYLIQALKKGKLIIDLNDPRKFSGNMKLKKDTSGLVIVLKESNSGENLVFLDIEKKLIISKDDFITKIKNGEYENYELRKIKGKETPVSKKDGLNFNNLG